MSFMARMGWRRIGGGMLVPLPGTLRLHRTGLPGGLRRRLFAGPGMVMVLMAGMGGFLRLCLERQPKRQSEQERAPAARVPRKVNHWCLSKTGLCMAPVPGTGVWRRPHGAAPSGHALGYSGIDDNGTPSEILGLDTIEHGARDRHDVA